MKRRVLGRVSSSRSLAALLALAVLSGDLAAQNAQGNATASSAAVAAAKEVLAKESYVTPPAAIAKIVTAPRHLNVTLSNPSPDRSAFMRTVGKGLPSVADFGKAHTYYGGLQVDTKANRVRSLTTGGAGGIEVIDAATGRARAIEVPGGATVSAPVWSPDGTKIAYFANFDAASHVYVADVKSGRSTQVTRTPVLATLVTTLDWTADSRRIVTVLVPDGRPAFPARPAVLTGPQVRINETTKNKTRTFASLLEDDWDKRQLEWFTTGQLALVDVGSKAVQKVGQPMMLASVDAGPNGQYFRVTTMEKPFSYTVQYNSFGQTDYLWDASGKAVAVLAKRPLRDGTGDDDDAPGFGGQAAGADSARRGWMWHPSGNGLVFLQQEPAPQRGGQQGGDSAAAGDAPRQGGAAARRKDRLYHWAPPFEANGAKVILESDNRMGEVLFSDDAKMVFVSEFANGFTHLYGVSLDQPTQRRTIFRVRGNVARGGGPGGGGGGFGGAQNNDSASFYNNPGTLVARRGTIAPRVAMVSSDGKSVYLQGTKYYPNWQENAPRGFVDKVDIATGNKTRVFESAADVYEEVTTALDDDMTRFVVSRESPTMVPDYFLRTSAGLTRLTNNKDYSPEMTNAIRKRVRVTRADGYELWVNLTLPAGYVQGTRLPAMFWFYPREYTDQAGYERTKRSENKNRFPQMAPRNMEMLVTQGYAVVQPDAPIFGEQGRMNDNYVPDLRNSLAAVIDELDRLGYVDRTRLGLGGHSYGAFSTVNAMVHTPFFKAGIAGDGAYNRTLTPNGFQSERRDLWAGRDTYLQMSPFLYADRLTGALLMYHGEEDQNVGTAPINSERLMHALMGMGKTASLYMYPYEDHGPATQETLLDLWGRWTAWLDVYVKNANAGKKDSKVAVQP